MIRPISLILAGIVVISLSGCGQKGPLQRPQASQYTSITLLPEIPDS